MITIRMYQGKWRLNISDEEWEFEDKIFMEEALKNLLSLKDIYGSLKGGNNGRN